MASRNGFFARARSGPRPAPPPAASGIVVASGPAQPSGGHATQLQHAGTVVEIVHTQPIQRIQVASDSSASAHVPFAAHVAPPIATKSPGSLFIPPHIVEAARPGTLVVYVLLCLDARFYIGKTSDLKARLEEHARGEGAGSQWTQKYRPQFLLEVRAGDGFQELSTTLEYMQNHGMDRVRGGDYTMVNLTDDHRAQIDKHLRGAADTCYTCGKGGHFAAHCPAIPQRVAARAAPTPPRELALASRPPASVTVRSGSIRQRSETAVCERCGRSGHTAGACYAKKHVDGSESMVCGRCGRNGHTVETCYASTYVSEVATISELCQRCGRDNHTADACYAKKHADGSSLSLNGNCRLHDGDDNMTGTGFPHY